MKQGKVRTIHIAFSSLEMKYYCVNFTFISSTNEGNPPMDINVTNPKTNAEQAARACRDKVVNALKSFISFMTAHVTTYCTFISAQPRSS